MLILKLANYSKANTTEEIAFYLKEYPQQKCNTIEAHKGLTLEFYAQISPNNWNTAVASLSEYHQITGHSQFKIFSKNERSFLIVKTFILNEVSIFKIIGNGLNL